MAFERHLKAATNSSRTLTLSVTRATTRADRLPRTPLLDAFHGRHLGFPGRARDERSGISICLGLRGLRPTSQYAPAHTLMRPSRAMRHAQTLQRGKIAVSG